MKRYEIMKKALDEHSYGEHDSPTVVSDYSKAILEDYTILISFLFESSRPVNKSINYSHELKFCITDNLVLDAFIYFSDDNQALVNVSFGLLAALDDLFSRLACSEDFFSFDPVHQGKKAWKGNQCIWFNLETLPYKPETRYLNYSFREDYHLITTTKARQGLGVFYSAIPWFDDERLEMAYFMSQIGLMWVLMHEEGHYTNGHLSYLAEKFSYLNEPIKISDSSSNLLDSESPDFLKVQEWQADVSATNAVIDFFFRADNFDFLPRYCKKGFESKVRWLLRLIIVSIGSTVLTLQKANTICGTSENYPAPRTRLLLSILVAYNRVADARFNSLISRAMHKEPLIISDIILGAFEDLLTVSDLINREQMVNWDNSGKAPLIGKTHNLELVDTEAEASIASILITGCICAQDPDAFLSHYVGSDKEKVSMAMDIHSHWFAEFDALRPKVQVVEDFLRKYRDSVAPNYWVQK